MSVIPVFIVPLYKRTNAILPTKGSVIILNRSALKGSLSLLCLNSSLSVFGLTPSMEGISKGEGRYSTIASRRFCTPLFLYELPHSTGTIFKAMVAFLIAGFSSSAVISLPSRNSSIMVSSKSETASIRVVRASSAISFISSGISVISTFTPSSSL